tara:strand:- start:496 stop:1812 length:1317 start_codon:yes stop_codon:yes gene_type:complete
MKEEAKGMWHLERETEKAVYLSRIQDNYKQWFPKKVVDGPNEKGLVEVESWFLQKNPLPPILEERVDLPQEKRNLYWKKGSLSFSKARQYLNCPKQYYFSYEKKIVSSVSSAMKFGNVAHSVLELIFECDLQMAKPTSYIQALTRKYWQKNKSEFETSKRKKGIWDDSKMDEVIDQVLWALTKMTHGKMDAASVQTSKPKHTESRIFSKDGLLGGIIDAVFVNENGEIKIIDYKTGKSTEGKIDSDHEFQGWLYAYLAYEEFGKMPKDVEFWYLGSQEVKKVDFDEDVIQDIVFSLKEIAAEIKNVSGSPESFFKANPSQKNCKWCDAKPWCKAYQKMVQDEPWQEEGYGKSIKGVVEDSSKKKGSRPGVAIVKTEDGGEILIKGWEDSGRILGELKKGDFIFCVDVGIKHSDISGNLEGFVNDPFSIIVNNRVVYDS